MKTLILGLFALVATGAGAAAQTPVQNQNPCLQSACFFATQSGTVASSGATTLTIQQPATAARQVTFMGAVVQCPGQSFTIGQSQNGTAATATAGTAVALIPIATINAGDCRGFSIHSFECGRRDRGSAGAHVSGEHQSAGDRSQPADHGHT